MKSYHGLEAYLLLRRHLCVETGFSTNLRDYGCCSKNIVDRSFNLRVAFVSCWFAPFLRCLSPSNRVEGFFVALDAFTVSGHLSPRFH